MSDARPSFGIKRGKWENIVGGIARWLGFIGRAKNPTGNEVRVLDSDKLAWIGATRKTIEDAQIRVRAGYETLYFRSYAEGTHMVIVEDGKVTDQYALISQYAPKLAEKQFEGALVERVRQISGLAP